MTDQKILTFHSGTVPAIGFGTYPLKGKECTDSVLNAIDVGYRHIDTAKFYENEAAFGIAVNSASVQREEIFLTTKIWNTDLHPKAFALAVEDSLRTMKVDYVDLLLIHWPSTDDDITYKAVEMLNVFQEKEFCRFIGASNFNLKLMTKSMTIAPLACNQIECHPYLSQEKMRNFIVENNLFLTAYCPLAQGEILKENIIKQLASKYNKNPNQIALRWFMQKDNLCAIPKASKENHRISNLAIWDFELSAEDMQAIDQLNQNKRIMDPEWSVDWAN